MAAELVGGALLSSFLGVLFDRLSSPEVVNWIRGKKLDQKLIQRLETSLCVVQAVLNDAEQKQVTDPAVKKCLTNLEDAVYLADDLLDEVSTKAATQKHPGNFLYRSFKFNLQGRGMVPRMEEVIDTIKEIAEHKDILGLKNIALENRSGRIASTSLVEKSDVYGRDEDKKAIIELLLNDSIDAKISVIPIVGMGGVGKTTVAQLVYNDDKIEEKFDFKAWVCVGEEFDVFKMTKTILGAEAEPSSNVNDLESVQLNLKKKLTGKRFLVVLDDMWNDSYDDWKFFQNPFQYGSLGSKILVTTRSDTIASMVKTIPTYKLSLLSGEHCWSVFAKHASLSPNSRDYSSLEKVGRKIVEKCKGLPLAAQTLGGLLRTKDDAREWNDILNSQIWEFKENESRILPALRISYHYLPSYLKRCFVFCSLYPKDYEFDRDELVLLWMGNDLLLSTKSGSTLEQIGYKYFDDLASRSFFQPSKTNERLFVMHDLMHDLAIFYAGAFYFRASEFGSTTKVDIKTRHLLYDVMDRFPFSKYLEACDRLKYLRTMLKVNVSREINPGISLHRLKCLRVLSFHFLPYDSFPDSIGELIHLRYLDLHGAWIKTLPESLGKLHNLQTLNLVYCLNLKMLPSSIQDLVNLRYLDIRDTPLQEMPKGMDKLKNLQFLSHYIAGRHNENEIREFGALTNLHGSLVIRKLENVLNGGEASEARMIDKVHIDYLEFNWSRYNIADDKDILDKLQPSTELKEIKICEFGGEIFSDWVGHSSYQSMTKLTLRKCRKCCRLPSLGQLPSLKHLEIEKLYNLRSIGVEFYKNDEFSRETPFPSLETLKLCTLDSWEVWHSSRIDAAFPQLKRLSISRCTMLTGDLPNHLPALEYLHIYWCNQLTCSLPSAPNILQLYIYAVNEVRFQELPLSPCSESISGSKHEESAPEAMTHTQLTCLRSLYISKCSSAISFPGARMPASLQDLEIRECKKLEFPMQQQRQQQSLHRLKIHDSCDSLISFPLAAFPNLTDLEIYGCENMKCLEVPQSKDAAALPLSLRDLRIQHCPSFVSLLSQSRDAALPGLRSLVIRECRSFVSFSTLGKTAPQLDHLTVYGCPEIDLFGEEGEDGCLPSTLANLHISGCEKLVTRLASSTVLHSCGLTDLDIGGACDNVKFFPREGCLPASLESMFFGGFPSLETLDCSGLLHLTSLQKLGIGYCPKLQNIVGESLPASLKKLSIYGSPLLDERCRQKDPPIWSKISHIPDILVGYGRIQSPRSSSDTDTEEKKSHNLRYKGYFKCLRI